MSGSSEVVGGVEQLILARRDAFAAGRDLYLTFAFGGSGVGRGGAGDAYDRNRPIFVQYMNPEVLSCYGLKVNGVNAEAILLNALMATRLAMLATDSYLVFPASYIFELSWFDTFLRMINPLVVNGHVRYTSPVSGVAEYRDIKASEYRKDSVNFYLTVDIKRITGQGHLVWTPRLGRSTAIDIGDQWARAISPAGELYGLVRSIAKRRHRPYARVERALEKTPERLDGQAFIKRFVENVLPAELTAVDSGRLSYFLSSAYLESYVTDLDAMMLIDLPLGELSCGVDQRYPDMKSRLVSARTFNTALGWLGLRDYVHKRATWDELAELRSSPDFGLVASAIGNGQSMSLTFAVLAARKSTHFRVAESYSQAAGNIAMIADGLTIFSERVPRSMLRADGTDMGQG